MLRKLIAAACFALLAFAAAPSHAQPVRILPTCGTISPAFAANSQSAILTMDVNGLLCTAASVSASITGFPTVQSTGTPISVTTSSATGTLPSGAVVVASNVGATNGAYCKLGASATTSDQLIPPNSWFAFTVGANTQLSCITSTSTTTVNMVGGSGLPTGSGGGGGGGGGGGAITAASGSYASGALSSGSIAAGAMVDLLTMRGTVGAGTAAANALLTGCIYNSSPITLTTGQGSATQCSVNGYPTVVVSNTNANGQATMANSSPVVLPSNMAAIPLWGHGATGAAAPANATYAGVLDASGGTNLLGLAGDPCQTSVKTTVGFTLATAAVKVAITGVSAKKIYVCSYDLNNNAADSVAIFEATTGTTCATAAAALVGAGTSVATAGTGYNWAANGGIAKGSGSNQILSTLTNAADLCIAQSAATQLSGTFTYVTR